MQKWQSTHSRDPQEGLPELYLMPDNQQYIINNGRLFCPNTGEYYRKGKFTKKQKRHYMRMNSGMKLAVARKERLTFLTLTTQYDPFDQKNKFKRIRTLNYAFTKLKQKIERLLQKKMYQRYCRKNYSPKNFYRNQKRTVIWGYELRNKKLSIKYPLDYLMFRFKLKYFKVKTAEGGGVLHIIFRKGFNVPMIPYGWLKYQWDKIWYSPQVRVEDVDIRNPNGLSMYMVGQYYAKQPVIRMSYGQQWVYQGFKKSFLHLIDVYGDARIEKKRDPETDEIINIRHGMRQSRENEYEPNKHSNWDRIIEVWTKKMKNNDLPTIALTHQWRFRHRKYPPECYHKEIRIIQGHEVVARWTTPPTHNIISKITPQKEGYQICIDSPKYTWDFGTLLTTTLGRPHAQGLPGSHKPKCHVAPH